MLTEQEILFQLETAAQRAYSRGIQTGSGGNLSARAAQGELMWVKNSGGSFADCDRTGKGFTLTDLDGKVVSQNGSNPTREVFLHGLMYKLRPEVGGVMHCHSPWAISWSFSKRAIPMITQHMKLKLGTEIPVLDILSPMVRPEDGPSLEALFAQYSNLQVFILVGHGVVALGKTVLEAEHTAELAEETATVAILSALCQNAGVYTAQ